MPPKAQKKKKVAPPKKKATKGTKSKDKAKGGNKAKGTKPAKKKPAAASKAAKDGNKATAIKKDSGGNKEKDLKPLLQVRKSADESWMRAHGHDTEDLEEEEEVEEEEEEEETQEDDVTGEEGQEENGDAQGEEDEEETDEISQYFDKLEQRVLATLSDLPYHVTSITETVQAAFRQHRQTMPMPEAVAVATTTTSGIGSLSQAPISELWSSTPSSSWMGSRTATFLNDEFGRLTQGKWATGGEHCACREGQEEGYVTQEEIYKTVQSYSAEIRRELSWSMRESPRRCRSASVDRLAVARPHSSRQQRIGCSCCRNNNATNVTNHANNANATDVTTDAVTSRPLTASSRTARMVRPRTAKGVNAKDIEKDLRKSLSKPPISPQARPTSRISFGIRHARSTSSVNAAGTSNVASSSRSHLTSEGHSSKVNAAGNGGYHDNEDLVDRLQDGRMSVSELPPIGGVTSGRRPGSGRSRRSSTHSQGSRSGGGGGSGNAVARAETTEIVALNGYADPGKMTKRSNRSPGSTGGSSGHAPSNGTGTSPRVTATGTGNGGNGSGGSSDGGIRFRAKSWCAPDGSSMTAVAAKAADSKLETLFEAKTQRQRRVSDNNVPRLTNGVGRGSSGGGPEEGGELFKRTKSFNNLSKGNDANLKPGAQGKQSSQHLQVATKSRGLQKVSSDQNIAGKGATGRTQAATTVRRRNASTGQNPNLGRQQQQQPQHKPLRVSKSTPNFESQKGPNNNNNNDPSSPSHRPAPRDDPKATIAAIAAANEKAETEVTSYSEDIFDDVDPEEGEREQRIIDWLIGVESERPERPPSPSIIDEEPTQTDTAIHIIYDGE